MTAHTTYTPHTFSPLDSGWTLTALNPELAPEALRGRLAAGIPATVPGEATIDLLNAGLIDDPFDGRQRDQAAVDRRHRLALHLRIRLA